MSHFSCLVQEDGAANERRSTLEERLAAHHAAHYPGEQPTFAAANHPPSHSERVCLTSTSTSVSAFE